MTSRCCSSLSSSAACSADCARTSSSARVSCIVRSATCCSNEARQLPSACPRPSAPWRARRNAHPKYPTSTVNIPAHSTVVGIWLNTNQVRRRDFTYNNACRHQDEDRQRREQQAPVAEQPTKHNRNNQEHEDRPGSFDPTCRHV